MGLRIMERDIQLFDRLSQYGMLSSKQINKLIFNEIALTTVLRRLRPLEKNGLLKRITGLSNMILWGMTSKALSFGGSEDFKRHWNKNQLEHELRLLTFRKYKIEASKVLNVKVSWLRQAVFRREIKHVKLGALVRFRVEDLHNHINRCLKDFTSLI